MAPDDLEVVVPAGVEDLLPTFLENRRKELDALQGAVSCRDLATVLHIAHRMKGVGEPYGFSAISSLGMEFHRAAEQANTPELISLLSRYGSYLREVRVSFEEA
jgi:HPt (histidine-containing phosphotransfer) domain-containing protein